MGDPKHACDFVREDSAQCHRRKADRLVHHPHVNIIIIRLNQRRIRVYF